ncbi:uncharacterized protein EI90DRAFT_3135178 [Cantharellus anzutake]|uniref:uncharacterized protein n=1 Tax=Cantharellus anzutake TaxID=1750568 RepID=UPI001904728B|nr:uncharacterized protein EI90DRAFT_3135178 [Cantharellus anzutake]KAF8315515.1 hypothetical protein EI90DRAFT_3135178 [Cantharellus anzutake]
MLPDFMIPILIKKSFIQLPTDNLITTATDDQSIDQHPILCLMDEGAKAGAVGMIPILNGHHRWEAMKMAFQICNNEIPKLETELASWEKQSTANPHNMQLKDFVDDCCSASKQRKSFLDKYDDRWLVIVYDQETIEKELVKGSLVIHSLCHIHTIPTSAPGSQNSKTDSRALLPFHHLLLIPPPALTPPLV